LVLVASATMTFIFFRFQNIGETMAIQHYPGGNRSNYDMIRSFTPSGSMTTFWAIDKATGQLVRMLRWGNEIYLPVYDGMEIGLCVHNGSNVWRAYPTYIEAKNLWDDGPSQPEYCDTDHMWEVGPGRNQTMDKLMNPYTNEGRPLIVTESGFGNTVGESTFGTDAYRGQIRLYERLQFGGGYQQRRQENQGYSQDDTLESLDGQVYAMGDPVSKDVLRGGSGRAGIGAGQAVRQDYGDTGVQYQPNAQPVITLRVEYRRDLQPMLNVAWANTPWSWYEPIPSGNWWNEPWSWRQAPRTSPQIPVIQPHNPNRRRRY